MKNEKAITADPDLRSYPYDPFRSDREIKARGGLSTTTCAKFPVYFDKAIKLRLEGRCPVCGKKNPRMFDIFRGNKGCKHWEAEMKALAEEEETLRYSVAELEKIFNKLVGPTHTYEWDVDYFIEFLKNKKEVEEILK